MQAVKEQIVVKRAGAPDDTRKFDLGGVNVFQFDPGVIMVATFEPGWKWSESLKSVAGTESCEVPHLNYVVAGRIAIKMDDGTQIEAGPGDTMSIPPGHDAWVVGNERCVLLDFSGGAKYALPSGG